jgi:glutaminyl-tRNA synthetase
VSVTKDPQTGVITELHCTYDPETKSGSSQEQRKVKATIHWVSAPHAAPATIRLYHPLLLADQAKLPADRDWTQSLNPQSFELLTGCVVEPSLRSATPGARFQFERQGYFCVDPDSSADTLVFNRTVSLKDAWAKIEKTQQAPQR